MSNIRKFYKSQVSWERIKLLIFDCDGVLTDGRIVYGEDGQEMKNFDAHDGMGFMILRQTEIKVAVITGRKSLLLERRCKDLKIDLLYQGVHRKLDQTAQILKEMHLGWDEVAYLGDDWNDIPVMERVAFAAAPADALQEIREMADHVCAFPGGRGAARDFIRHILVHQGRYDQAVEAYLHQIS